ncbi:unnamed protein product [Phytophthora lilii]|uniref:Unnamed protein product n=1 Tax=Phytophthora lilii TaxID=2077276 RepID=A0A9W6WHQ4_9STRA|nr:unnamed protein product [Phytophthora lilii]
MAADATSTSSASGHGRKAARVPSQLLMEWRESEECVSELEAVKGAENCAKDEVEAEPDDDTLPTEAREFEVSYECLPDVEEAENAEEQVVGLVAHRPMQYLDVLLQTDEHGIGLNVGLERLEDAGQEQVVVVQSFCRLKEGDIGPAEACGKIRVGDILHAVDGEEICSLQQLHTKLAGRMGKRRKFVLLRFLRSVTAAENGEMPMASFFDQKHRATDTKETHWSDIELLIHSNPQLGELVRRLATTNQLLQEQLVASRLKQEEQSIQLDQLHALYSRTQAEGLPLFSLSKSIRPFSRKSSSSRASDASLEKPIPTKIQTEVLEAINVEYSRLRQEFQLQHLLDKRELERKYAEKAQKLEEATAKKVEMLEAGFKQALEHYTNGHHCTCHSWKTSMNGSKALVTDHQNDGKSESGGYTKPFGYEREGHAMQRILELLAEYEDMKRVRAAKLRLRVG